MSQLDPAATSVGDLCTAALKESGAIGVGQTPLAEDLSDAQARLQWMLQEWERKRWLVYHLKLYEKISTGVQQYSVGPGGDIDTGVGTVRPARVEAAALRQLVSGGQPVDYPLEILESKEDWLRVTLKSLTSYTGGVYYDPGWPLGTLLPVPIPQAGTYSLLLLFVEQLPTKFVNPAVVLNLPYEYYNGILYNLALRLRPKYGIGTYAGDMVPSLAKDSLEAIRGANTQIARLTMPAVVLRAGIYNIFSDRSY